MLLAGGRSVGKRDHHSRRERVHQRPRQQGGRQLGRRDPVAGRSAALRLRVESRLQPPGAGLQQHRAPVPIRRVRLQRHVYQRPAVRRRRRSAPTSSTLHRHPAGAPPVQPGATHTDRSTLAPRAPAQHP